VEYLGHIVSLDGVKVDLKKLKYMVECQILVLSDKK
jgi:hypothetical protein